MSPEAQRIAIAEECGHIVTDHERLTPAQWKTWYEDVKGICPDYLNDLNAAMDVARQLAKSGWRCAANMGTDGSWECFFTKRASSGDIPTEGDHYGAGDTLAKALAEAYLRTIGKWKD